MQSEEVILSPIPPQQIRTTTSAKKLPIRLFSLLVLMTTFIGVWQWYDNYSTRVGDRHFSDLSRDDLMDVLEYDNGLSVEEVVLKYKIYRVPLAAYIEPNILLTLCIIITFPYVLNFIESESATPIAFFELNLSSIYLQILRLGVDLAHYLVASKCICLTSGAGAVWVHLLTKITCYNSHKLLSAPLQFVTTLLAFIVAFTMILMKDRLDLLIGIGIALIDVAFMEGGTVKYPKQVFQQKEEWAAAIKLNRSSLWQNFYWNEYKVNERLCVDSMQYFVTRQERTIMIS